MSNEDPARGVIAVVLGTDQRAGEAMDRGGGGQQERHACSLVVAACGGQLAVMSLSPDALNIVPVIRRLREKKISVFITHTRASVEQTEAARFWEYSLPSIYHGVVRSVARQPGRVLTHRALLKEVWGPDHTEETHYLRVFTANLRRKLEREPHAPVIVQTVVGAGYRRQVRGYDRVMQRIHHDRLARSCLTGEHRQPAGERVAGTDGVGTRGQQRQEGQADDRQRARGWDPVAQNLDQRLEGLVADGGQIDAVKDLTGGRGAEVVLDFDPNSVKGDGWGDSDQKVKE